MPNKTIDILRAQWSQYNNLAIIQTNSKQYKKKHKEKEQRKQRLIQKRNFHYICPHCDELIFYNQYWFDDFQNRYIPLSTYTYRPHRCYNKEAEKKEGLMNGTFVVPRLTSNFITHYTTPLKKGQLTQ